MTTYIKATSIEPGTILETYSSDDQCWQLFRVIKLSSAYLICTLCKNGRVVQHNSLNHCFTVWHTKDSSVFQIGSCEARIVGYERMFEFQLMMLI